MRVMREKSVNMSFMCNRPGVFLASREPLWLHKIDIILGMIRSISQMILIGGYLATDVINVLKHLFKNTQMIRLL